jgi:hypothetical protein
LILKLLIDKYFSGAEISTDDRSYLMFLMNATCFFQNGGYFQDGCQSRKQRSYDSIPPTQAALIQHIERAA